MRNIENLLYDYNQRKAALVKEHVPFLSYLHHDPMRETCGYQFIKLIDVSELPIVCTPRDYMRVTRTTTNWLTKRGRQRFDRIVRDLRRAGTLVDVTEYIPEGGDT